MKQKQKGAKKGGNKKIFVHKSAQVDTPMKIGSGTKIWHFTHVMPKAEIGENCVLGQNVYVAETAVIGNNVRVQNNVSLYDGVVLEDDVFCGPSSVFMNVIRPRSEIVAGRENFSKTLVRRGATIGANATIVCGITIGRHAFIGAGAVVTKNVPDYALMIGVPAKQSGWVGRHGVRLKQKKGMLKCPISGWKYKKKGKNIVCTEWDEDRPLSVSGERVKLG